MARLRLSKLMAQRGLCSRREADDFIERGWVFVDGQRVDRLGTKVDDDQQVRLDSSARRRQRRLVTVLLNKPIGYVSGQPVEGYPPAVTLINDRNMHAGDPRGGRVQRLRGLAPAGRLDIDSQGLLVLTQDGRIARHLIGPDSEIEKEYLVRVRGTVTRERIEQLRHGLSLDGKPLKHAGVYRQGEGQLRFVLTEGRKRQIRRMCELVDLEVTRLKRVRIGNVRLRHLPLGKWRALRTEETF